MNQISMENYQQIQSSMITGGVTGLLDQIGRCDAACLGLEFFPKYSKILDDHEAKNAYGLCIGVASNICTDFQTRLQLSVYSFQDLDELPNLEQLFRLNLPVVVCQAKPILHTLWDFGLYGPRTVWDIVIYERANSLGKIHINYQIKEQDAYSREFEKNLQIEKARFTSVAHMASRYEVNTPYTEPPYLSHSIVGRNMLTYMNIYFAQVNDAARKGTLEHIVNIEMPWVITNAQIEYNGVRVDAALRRRYVEAYQQHVPKILQKLKDQGLRDITKDRWIHSCLNEHGILEYFKTAKGYSINKDTLKEYTHIHPIIKQIADARKIVRIKNEQIMSVDLPRINGRVRATHTPLATETGRQSAVEPNVLGLNGLLRTLIIPDEGNGIAEVDLSQIEVGIAAAYYHDTHMIEAFNTGDVYAAMAQRFYAQTLSEEDRALSGPEFKQKFPKERNLLKRCTLSILYGSSTGKLATSLGVRIDDAAQFIETFYSLFPGLQEGLDREVRNSMRRGYIQLISGLRIYLDPQISEHARQRLCRNYPIQGSAAAVFKHAGNRLRQLYKGYNAKILVPLHDSYVFEAPRAELHLVAELTSRTMCEAVREYFPELMPRTETTIAHPERWTKNDDIGIVERWITYGNP